MFAFLTPVDGVKTDPLVDAQTAERFWQSLPRRDPVMSQKVMSDALADLTTAGHPTAGHICALLMLGKRTRKLTEALLINYGEVVPKLQPLERKYWQAAFELSQSFRHCFLELVRCSRDGAPIRDWEEYAPLVLLRYFQHRQVESLLRPFVGPKPRLLYSSEVHEVYNYARAQGLASQPVVVRRFHEQSSGQTTLEREYIHVLLSKLMRSAQLAPHEAFWVNQQLPRWCEAMELRPSGPDQAPADRTGCFIVAPDDPEGLVRAEANDASACLCLDPSPMLACMHDEIARLRDAGDRPPPASFTTDRQLKALRKVCIVFSPQHERIRRRGERRFVASTVEIAMGLAQIMRALRQEQRLTAAARSTGVPEVEEITITEYGAYTETSPVAPSGPGDAGPGALAGDICASYDVWQLKDRSDSGCRLHGQITDGKAVLPGTLLAFREGGAGPWIVAVVRRLRLMIGNHVEIGVEFVGRDPRLVKMVASDSAQSWIASPNKGNRSFAALYLPESARHPVMPIKTVILPARGFASGVCLTLTTANAEYTVRLKEPIEEQAEFSWLACEILERCEAEKAA